MTETGSGNRLSSSAPGKLVLAGEYAVLDGAPAIAMAVNCRAQASVCRDAEPDIECVGYSGDRRLAEAVAAEFDIDPAALLMRLDTREFSDESSGRKYGLGSSAALAVALAGAFAGDDMTDEQLHARAYSAHSAFQDGKGSGVDVACALHGGLLRYRMTDREAGCIDWPDGLHYAVLWSGLSASTRERIDRLAGAGSKPSRESLAVASVCVADAWVRGDAAGIIDAYTDYLDTLQAFDADHSLGVFEAGHDELLGRARSAGLTYKPCGAGGGDSGIVLGLDADLVGRFADSSGFRRLDVRLDPVGVTASGARQ